MKHPALLAAVVFTGLAAAAAATPPACVPHVLGSDGRGPAFAIARTGDTLYVGAGAALLVLDISDEVHPVQVAKLEIGQVVRGLALAGSTTLVATGLDQFFLVDVSDRAHPVLAGSYPPTADGRLGRAAPQGTLLFFTALDGNLHVVDISDPTLPTEIGSYAANHAYSVAVSGNRAYLADWEGLRVLDVSDPAHITSVTYYEGAGGGLSISGNGRRLVRTGGCGPVDCTAFEFADLDDPDHPLFHSTWYTDCCEEAVLVGGRAYITDGEVVDLSDLDNPVLLGWLPSGYFSDLAATASRVYAAAQDRGVLIYGVTDPASSYEIGSFPAPAPTSGGFLENALAFTVTEDAVRVFDLSDPARPELVANKRIGIQPMWGFEPAGDFGLAGSSGSRVRVWDLTDPLRPEPAGSFGSRYLFGFAVRNGYAYSAGYASDSNKLQIFDVGDPEAPFEVGEISFPWLSGSDLSVDRGLAALTFTWYGEAGVRLYDVSDPAHPVGVTEIPLSYAWKVRLHAGLLLASDYYSGNLYLYDVRDPAHPELLGTTGLGARPQAIATYGSLAAVVTEDPEFSDWYEELSLVHFLDLGDPAHPVELASVRVPGEDHRVTMGPGRALVADGNGGMSVLETCAPFADGFESGDASAWSRIVN
jgi:hypothetical protein